jgi:hypothetical protein
MAFFSVILDDMIYVRPYQLHNYVLPHHAMPAAFGFKKCHAIKLHKDKAAGNCYEREAKGF